jgi:hypothetical protein
MHPEADLKVALSRVAAYQRECDIQGRKLSEIETVLREASNEGVGDDIGSLHYRDPVLQRLASILGSR